MIMMIMMMKMM